MEWIRFIIDFMFVPAILAIVGLIGGIVLLLVRRKIKKKSLLIAGIAAFAVAAVCIIYITGYLLIYIIGGSLFGEGSLSPQYRSDWIDDEVVGVITEDNSVISAKIAPLIQEYKGDNIAEILQIAYDGKNSGIDAINNEIESGVLKTYNEFMKNSDDVYWIEIRSYPFTSDDYLQIVMTYVEYPIYGTDGEIWSYNFNRKENRRVTVDEIMSKLGLSENSLAQKVKELYVPENSFQSVGEVKAKGFLITSGPSEPITQLLLQVTVENSEAEPWESFYNFIPQTNELYPLNSYCLFDPYDMDEMEPPLSYGRNW